MIDHPGNFHPTAGKILLMLSTVFLCAAIGTELAPAEAESMTVSRNLTGVQTRLETEVVKTAFGVKIRQDRELVIGETKVAVKGKEGICKRVFAISSVDGKELARYPLKTLTVQKKQDRVIVYGTKILSGIPRDLVYQKKISDVCAVSYYYDGNPHGAYGGKCEYGTCAVDPALIPLGSLLYVEGYGYAVANDVGNGVKGKTVDLYMERLRQCCIWGARRCDVYIIRSGPATQQKT